MSDVQLYSFDGAQVRTLNDEHGEPWFLGMDVCAILGLGTEHLRRDLEDDEVTRITTLPNWQNGESSTIYDGMNGGRPPLVVSESGVYSLIMHSRKPEAKRFKRWVTHEVLPSIRRHGAYATDKVIDKVLDDPDFGIRLLIQLKDERARRRDAERTIEAQRPKVLFADAVASGGRDILVGELAKILRQNGVDTGQNRLFDRLRREGYLMRRNGVPNMPTQRSADLGLFRVVENAVTHSDGHVTATYTTKVTPKGQQYFVNRYLGAGASE